MDLDEIRAMNPNEARKLPVEELVKAIYEGETYTANEYLYLDEYGNRREQGWEVRNSYDGNLVSTHKVTWTYHDAEKGVVKDIDVQEGNRVQRISHSADAKVQPTATRLTVIEETVGDKVFDATAGPVSGGLSGLVNRILGRG